MGCCGWSIMLLCVVVVPLAGVGSPVGSVGATRAEDRSMRATTCEAYTYRGTHARTHTHTHAHTQLTCWERECSHGALRLHVCVGRERECVCVCVCVCGDGFVCRHHSMPHVKCVAYVMLRLSDCM